MGTIPQEPEAGTTGRVAALELSRTDDPRVLGDQHHDDYANHVVPRSVRVGKWQLSMSFWSLLSAMVWLFYGALASSLFGSWNAIIAMVLAVVVYSAVGGIITRWCIRTGLNATLLSRQTFGVLGAIFVALLLTINMVYYAVFESSTLAVAFHSYTPTWPIEAWYAIVCVLMLPLMLGGVQTFMAKLNGGLLPFYYIGLIAAVITTAIRFPVGTAWLDFGGIVPPEARAYPGWVLAFMLYMGLFILMPTTANFARLGKVEDEKFHSVVSFGPVFHSLLLLVNGVVGIFLVRSVIPNEPAAETGVVTAILSSMGVVGLILIVVSQARINTLNYYEASTNASRFIGSLTGRRVPRLALVLGLTVIVFLLMFTNVFSYIQAMLGWQAAFMVGWAGILVTHLILTRGWSGTEFRAQRTSRVTAGFVAWLISAGVAIALEEVPGVPAQLSAIAPVFALVIAVGLYILAFKLAPGLKHPAVSDIRDEVDPWADYVKCGHCEKSYIAYEMDRNEHASDQHALCDACAIGNRARHFD